LLFCALRHYGIGAAEQFAAAARKRARRTTAVWSERVDSLLEFKSFFFLKEVQENFLSFLSSGDDGSTGHLLSRD
jgi:hypothetical protein